MRNKHARKRALLLQLVLLTPSSASLVQRPKEIAVLFNFEFFLSVSLFISSLQSFVNDASRLNERAFRGVTCAEYNFHRYFWTEILIGTEIQLFVIGVVTLGEESKLIGEMYSVVIIYP